jgi:hypothetical protein
MDKTGFEREIGFGGFEHLAAPSSPSRQRRGLSGRSHPETARLLRPTAGLRVEERRVVVPAAAAFNATLVFTE